MTDTLLINPQTQQQLDTTWQRLPGALLISGATGVGLATIVRHYSGQDIGGVWQPMTNGDVASTGTINVDAIRSLQTHARTRHVARHIYIIDDADRMSSGAQAAFLKLLEEPGVNVHFVLTSHHPERLLPTVRSRVQHVKVLPITNDQTLSLINAAPIDNKKKSQLQFVAAGLPAEIHRLLADSERFDALINVMGDARTYVQGTAYDKMIVISRYHNDRTQALLLVDCCIRIIRRTLGSQPSAMAIQQLDRLTTVYESLQLSGNIRLQLARTVV